MHRRWQRVSGQLWRSLLLWEEVAVAAESAGCGHGASTSDVCASQRGNRVKTSQLKQVIDTHVLSRFWATKLFGKGYFEKAGIKGGSRTCSSWINRFERTRKNRFQSIFGNGTGSGTGSEPVRKNRLKSFFGHGTGSGTGSEPVRKNRFQSFFGHGTGSGTGSEPVERTGSSPFCLGMEPDREFASLARTQCSAVNTDRK